MGEDLMQYIYMHRRPVLYLIRDSFPPLLLKSVWINDLIPQRSQSHIGSLRNQTEQGKSIFY